MELTCHPNLIVFLRVLGMGVSEPTTATGRDCAGIGQSSDAPPVILDPSPTSSVAVDLRCCECGTCSGGCTDERTSVCVEVCLVSVTGQWFVTGETIRRKLIMTTDE